MSCLAASVIVGVLSTLIGTYYYYTMRLDSNFPIKIKWKYDTSNGSDQFMTEYLASLGRPVVMTDSPLAHHEVMQWSFEGLANSLSILPCKYSETPVFTYHAVDQPLDTVPAFSVHKPYQDITISAREFFHKIQTPSDKFFYASGGVELLKLPLSFESLANITFPPNKGPRQVNYWFGGANVTAYTHYDTSHNLHLVIRGKKRFLLSPPSYRPNLFPCLHTLYRQTQTDISRPQIVLDVFPGEVLYLPPYWLHSVITVKPSISLNMWIDSEDFLLMEEVLSSPIPFEAEWDREKLVHAAKHFIDSLTERLDLPESFVSDRVLSRYQLLLANVSSSERHELRVKAYCIPSSLSDQDLERINYRVLQTASLYLSMSSIEVMEINFGNYIEHIFYTILRDQIIELPFFFKHCFKP